MERREQRSSCEIFQGLYNFQKENILCVIRKGLDLVMDNNFLFTEFSRDHGGATLIFPDLTS